MDAQAVAYGVGIGLGLAFGTTLFSYFTYWTIQTFVNYLHLKKDYMTFLKERNEDNPKGGKL